MVLTRNRSKAVASNPELAIELPLPTRARRTSRGKPSLSAAVAAVIVEEMHDTDTAENSSATPESESNTEDDPRQEEEEESSGSHTHTPQLQEDKSEESEESDSESDDEDKAEEKEASSPSSEDEDEDEEEDLSQLLVKAQESLKRKAMFAEAESEESEPRFNFPKLQNKLDTDNVYIQQEGNRVKVNLGTVVVIDKNGGSKVPGGGGIIAARKAKSGGALETCEVNMNAEKVHVSKKQKQEVAFERMATETMVLYSVLEEREKTTGKGWFDLPQQVMTPELKRDLQILKLRNVLDPKRFYKREEKGKPKFPKYFQVGTIIEGNTEFYSSRLTKKERATTITGEVMKDEVGRDYYKRKFDEIQVSKQSGGKRFNKKGKGKQSKSWRAGK
ncbi:hypothetical protein BG006_009232 [Podila minutissima]|uniref:Fcf2 pre-rRNA processing C-terminal domain-containing protein n=1 Tax=Podila minutissima TaxID=64525 RepID=A0A9P5VJF9_9FUNG|nr:hypothetical protein BG006_009232 [Podila minutissima]